MKNKQLTSDGLEYFYVLKKMDQPRFLSRQKAFHQPLTSHIYNGMELSDYYYNKYGLNLDIVLSKNIFQIHDNGEYLDKDVDAKKILEGKVLKEEKEALEIKAWNSLESVYPKKSYREKRNYWEMFENKSNFEALYANLIDKLEAMLHMSTVSSKFYRKKSIFNPKGFTQKDYDMSAKYADENFKLFIENMKQLKNPGDLEGLLSELKKIKLKFKEKYELVGAKWKEEYNYGMN